MATLAALAASQRSMSDCMLYHIDMHLTTRVDLNYSDIVTH